MYRSKRAKWIKIIVLISFFLSYLPFIILFNYLRTLPEYTCLFNDHVICGNSIFFPWLSSINLLEFIPMKEHLIRFSLGNLLDIILFCNILSYFDALLYHYFVKRIITERENHIEHNLIYYSKSFNMPGNKKRVGGPRIVYPPEDDFSITIDEYNWDIKKNRHRSFPQIKNGNNNFTKFFLCALFYKYILSRKKGNQIILSSFLSCSSLTFNSYPPFKPSHGFPINNYLIVIAYYNTTDENPSFFSFFITSINFLSFFTLNIKDFLPFYPFYVHTFTPNLSRKNCDLEFLFIHLCEICFLITGIYSAVIRNGIKQLNLNLKTKIVDD